MTTTTDATPLRPPGRGGGLDGPPCPKRADLDQHTPAGQPPCQRMCIRCGKVTARNDRDGLAWCGGDRTGAPA